MRTKKNEVFLTLAFVRFTQNKTKFIPVTVDFFHIHDNPSLCFKVSCFQIAQAMVLHASPRDLGVSNFTKFN